jgi:sugar fermentation stimulation protein A
MNIKLKKAIIINRPSKTIKSPYLADIIIKDTNETNETTELAHSPSLGLCGLIINETQVMVSTCEEGCRKSKYTIELVYINNVGWIGANPQYGNKIFSSFINKFSEFNEYKIEKAEVKVLNSRLDFLLVNDKNEKFYVEVKNVPLVDSVVDSDNKSKKIDNSDKSKKLDKSNNKGPVAAIFPDGYKNSKNQCISDRAYKHLEELIELKKKGFRTALVFIIQREDPDFFKPNYTRDKIYSEKLKEAHDKGVEIYAYKFKWTIKNNIGSCKFIKKIPINFENK